MHYLFLRVDRGLDVPLGCANEPGDVAELLRHIADFYDDNPAEAAALLSASRPASELHYMNNPFAAP